MKCITSVAALAWALVVAGAVLAADEQTPPNNPPAKPARGQRDRRGGPDVFNMLNRLDLTAEQKDKVAELKKTYGPKLKALEEKREAVTTPEQKKAREEAGKAARAAGKRGQEVRQAGEEAMKLTADQKAKQSEIRKEATTLFKEIREKIEGLLTADQKAKLQERGNRRRGDRPAAEGAQPKPTT